MNYTVQRRNGWREAYYTLRMFVASGALLHGAMADNKWQIALASLSTLYWWFKSGDEASKP